jgi:hypothetical protein
LDVAILKWLTGRTDWSVVHIAVTAPEQFINRMVRGMRPSLNGDSHGNIVGLVVIVMFGSFPEGSQSVDKRQGDEDEMKR